MKGDFFKGTLDHLICFFRHFRYPASLPDDIVTDLGLELPKAVALKRLIETLTSPHLFSKKFTKFMAKEEAEAQFTSALKKESFRNTTLFSYFFNEGWLVVTLYFDENDRLRRLNVQCPTSKESIDLPLPLSPLHPSARLKW